MRCTSRHFALFLLSTSGDYSRISTRSSLRVLLLLRFYRGSDFGTRFCIYIYIYIYVDAVFTRGKVGIRRFNAGFDDI